MRVQQIQQRLSLEGRYASALYAEAAEKNTLADARRDFEKFNELIHNAPELLAIFNSQLITHKTITTILTELQSTIGFSNFFLNFLIAAAKNKRLKILPEIFKVFASIIDDTLGTIHAKIQIAKNDQTHKSAVEQIVTSKYPGKTIQYSYQTVPELLGGFRAFINEECLDYSLACRLNRLRQQLKEA